MQAANLQRGPLWLCSAGILSTNRPHIHSAACWFAPPNSRGRENVPISSVFPKHGPSFRGASPHSASKHPASRLLTLFPGNLGERTSAKAGGGGGRTRLLLLVTQTWLSANTSTMFMLPRSLPPTEWLPSTSTTLPPHRPLPALRLSQLLFWPVKAALRLLSCSDHWGANRWKISECFHLTSKISRYFIEVSHLAHTKKFSSLLLIGSQCTHCGVFFRFTSITDKNKLIHQHDSGECHVHRRHHLKIRRPVRTSCDTVLTTLGCHAGNKLRSFIVS